MTPPAGALVTPPTVPGSTAVLVPTALSAGGVVSFSVVTLTADSAGTGAVLAGPFVLEPLIPKAFNTFSNGFTKKLRNPLADLVVSGAFGSDLSLLAWGESGVAPSNLASPFGVFAFGVTDAMVFAFACD